MSLNVDFFWPKMKLVFLSAYTLRVCRKDSVEEMHIKKYLTESKQMLLEIPDLSNSQVAAIMSEIFSIGHVSLKIPPCTSKKHSNHH